MCATLPWVCATLPCRLNLTDKSRSRFGILCKSGERGRHPTGIAGSKMIQNDPRRRQRALERIEGNGGLPSLVWPSLLCRHLTQLRNRILARGFSVEVERGAAVQWKLLALKGH